MTGFQWIINQLGVRGVWRSFLHTLRPLFKLVGAKLRMPRFNPPGAVVGSTSLYRVDFLIGYKAQRYQARLDYLLGGTTLGHNNTLAAQIIADWSRTEWLNVLPSDATWDGVRLTDLQSPTDRPVESVGTAGVGAGQVAGVSMPGQIAALARKRSLLRGQHGMGHMFIPCVPVGFVTAGVINATGVTAYTDLLEKLNTIPTTTLDDRLLIPVISRRSAGSSFEPVNEFTAIVEMRLSTNPTDRSTRKVGRGR